MTGYERDLLSALQGIHRELMRANEEAQVQRNREVLNFEQRTESDDKADDRAATLVACLDQLGRAARNSR